MGVGFYGIYLHFIFVLRSEGFVLGIDNRRQLPQIQGLTTVKRTISVAGVPQAGITVGPGCAWVAGQLGRVPSVPAPCPSMALGSQGLLDGDPRSTVSRNHTISTSWHKHPS